MTVSSRLTAIGCVEGLVTTSTAPILAASEVAANGIAIDDAGILGDSSSQLATDPDVSFPHE